MNQTMPRTPGAGDPDKHTMVSVMVVDDHAFAREGLRNLINSEPGFRVRAEAESSEAALASLAAVAPDMCVIDISLPSVSGIELTKAILRALPRCRILIFSAYHKDEYADVALNAGALGYVGKTAPIETLLLAIRTVGRGETFKGGDAERGTSTPRAGGAPDELRPSAVLTSRELEVFHLMGNGLSSRTISEMLSRSIKTIDAQRQSIKGKLRMPSMSHLVSFAARWRQANEGGKTSPFPADEA